MNQHELQVTALKPNRRHDLDALRGFAMLLGIVLHANMSFLPGIKPLWGVEDILASSSHTLLSHVIHGWRMQLFFFISGFFTMMLWRKRGSKALLIHRAKRIFLPLVLAMITVTPCWWMAQDYVRSSNSKRGVDTKLSDLEKVDRRTTGKEKYLVATPIQDESEVDPWQAIFADDVVSLDTYLGRGGNKNLIDPASGSSLLHAACFYGKSDVAALLIDARADQKHKNRDGLTPEDLLTSDWATTQFIANLTGVKVEQEQVEAGRDVISELLADSRERERTASDGLSANRKEVEIDIFLSTLADDSTLVREYLESGGDPNRMDPKGSTPLHAACFFGKANAARELILAEADLYAKNNEGQIPQELLFVDWGTTQFIAGMLKVKLDADDLNQGRMKIASIISEKTGDPIDLPDLSQKSETAGKLIGLLFFFPFFNHLWFLWFLSWFVIFSVFIFEVANSVGLFKASPKWIHSRWRFLILIPMTAVPQYYMARMPETFGPDTSVGFIP
ncbi:MAG: acyltransferase family protein, partial [Rubripirellula sp.]